MPRKIGRSSGPSISSHLYSISSFCFFAGKESHDATNKCRSCTCAASDRLESSISKVFTVTARALPDLESNVAVTWLNSSETVLL